MTLEAGADISGRYTILDRLGVGGMGEVFRARDNRLGREVALKVVSAVHAGDEAAEARFLREARAVASLSHPNIVTLFDFGIDAGRSYAAMELLEGTTLRTYLAASKLTWQKAVEIAAAVADGLAVAHSRGIIHRDLKPENIFVTREGRVKILDFGLARLLPDATIDASDTTHVLVTEPGRVMGTYGYMAPEQARGGDAGPSADLFSLGCILYELAAGRRAFDGATRAEVITAVLRDDPAPLGSDVPEDLARIVSRCLEKDPDQRFQSARDLTFQLRGLLSAGASSSVSSGSRRAIRSIAVCPFANASGDPEGDYLSEGIATSINSRLSRVRDLRVMSRATMARFKSRDIDPVAVCQELSVRALLTGRVLHRGSTLGVSVELVSGEDGSVLWSENYQRQWSDVLAIEEEIAGEISERLRLKIEGEQPEKTPQQRPAAENPEAYRLFLKGRFHCEKRTADGLRKGIAHYQEAIEIDPGYASAYAGIAEAYNLLGFYCFLQPNDAFPKARAAALKALALDESSADAHCARAYTHFYYEWDWHNADVEYRRAIELNPSHANARQFYAAYLVAMGRTNESLTQVAAAEERDPLGLPVKTAKGWVLFLARRFDEAIAELHTAIEMDPSFATARHVLGWCYTMSGRAPEAVAQFEIIAMNAETPTFYRSSYGHALACAGMRDKALAVLEELEAARSRRYVAPLQLAVLCAALGEHDRAFAFLDECITSRAWQTALLAVDARLDVLRTDPRFERLLVAAGFTPPQG